MTEPYPREIRQLAGDDVTQGVQAPGVPGDPQALAEGGGAGTGLVVASPFAPGDQLREDIVGRPDERDATDPGHEVVSGYVMDLACLRRYPSGEYSARAAAHTTECALIGTASRAATALSGRQLPDPARHRGNATWRRH